VSSGQFHNINSPPAPSALNLRSMVGSQTSLLQTSAPPHSHFLHSLKIFVPGQSLFLFPTVHLSFPGFYLFFSVTGA
jgi:hypothetical protein